MISTTVMFTYVLSVHSDVGGRRRDFLIPEESQFLPWVRDRGQGGRVYHGSGHHRGQVKVAQVSECWTVTTIFHQSLISVSNSLTVCIVPFISTDHSTSRRFITEKNCQNLYLSLNTCIHPFNLSNLSKYFIRNFLPFLFKNTRYGHTSHNFSHLTSNVQCRTQNFLASGNFQWKADNIFLVFEYTINPQNLNKIVKQFFTKSNFFSYVKYP